MMGPRCLMNREAQIGVGSDPGQLDARQEDLLAALKVGKGAFISREASKPHKLTLGGGEIDLTTDTPLGQETNSKAKLRDGGCGGGDVVSKEEHLDNSLELRMRPREFHPVEGRPWVPIDVEDEVNKDAQEWRHRSSLGGAPLLEKFLTKD